MINSEIVEKILAKFNNIEKWVFDKSQKLFNSELQLSEFLTYTQFAVNDDIDSSILEIISSEVSNMLHNIDRKIYILASKKYSNIPINEIFSDNKETNTTSNLEKFMKKKNSL